MQTAEAHHPKQQKPIAISESTRLTLPLSALIFIIGSAFGLAAWATEIHIELGNNTEQVAEVKSDVKDLHADVKQINSKVDRILAVQKITKPSANDELAVAR